ncbi:D-alanyl-D-alanine carboxypeptidase/D-alanyl-D-alanine-endopeptidase [candidate division KSB1 bacterium]|nr:D-alanyl-D-alanine carboxypeptidase/D-alanyl-D-alanine-endopeptidase [candidate division KSB1 bacterium]
MRLTRLGLLFFISLICCGLSLRCAHHTTVSAEKCSSEKLELELNGLFGQPQFANAHWGVAIRSLETGQVLYQHNADKGFMPASNMKLFTTAAALIKLGPEFHYQTDILALGQIDSLGVLHGDLVVRGSGDPSISGRYTDGDITAVFRHWADSLRVRNIRRISGRVVGDDSFFDNEILGNGWSWDYQSDYYAAQISALSFNENCVDLLFLPGDSVGALTHCRLEPNTTYVTVENRVVTGAADSESEIYLQRQRGGNQVVCTGTLSISEDEKRDWVTVEDPTLYTATVLRQVLEESGIRVDGEAAVIEALGDVADGAKKPQLLFTHHSPPLNELIRTINKVSQNLFAELLFRTTARWIGGAGNAKTAEKAEKEIFAEMGIPPQFVVLADGSGLSRLNLVTPNSVVQLLTYLRRHAYGELFYSSLPVAGEDGTLAKRMIGTAAQKNVRAKTGYIGRVRALSGYVTTKDGEELAFSMIANNYTVPTSLVNHVQDTVCERLANFSR